MGFVEATYLVLGIFLGITGIAIVRWMLLRPIRKQIAGDLIEELNGFNTQIRRLTERMGDLTRTLEARKPGALMGDDVEIGETMSEMNRLLREINEFFAREESEGLGMQASDFSGPDEEEKFDHMEEITDDELKRTDWDRLIDQLREEHEKH